MKRIPHVTQKGTLFRRAQLALGLIKGEPILYRVGITSGKIYLPATLQLDQCYIVENEVYKVDLDGTLIPFYPDEMINIKKFEP